MAFSSLENTDKKNASKIFIAKMLVLMLYFTMCICVQMYIKCTFYQKKKKNNEQMYKQHEG